MGCYGIGVSRVLAIIYENSVIRDSNGKVQGIALPTNISPYILQIISKGDNDIKNQEAQNLYQMLIEKNVKVILDDRYDITLGAKIKDVKMLGTPYIALLGDKVNNGEVELENTRSGEKVIIKQEELVEKLSEFDKVRIGNPEICLENFIAFNKIE